MIKNFPKQTKIPTRQHVQKLKRYLKYDPKSVIYHRGGITGIRDDTDTELDFRQESNFFYLSGVEKAGFHILILFEPSKIYLVPPTVPAADQLWKGTPDTHQQLLEKYDVDGIITEEELPSFIYAINPSTIYSLITTSTSVIPHHFTNKVDKTVLQSAINEARLTKSEWEIGLLRRSAHVSSHAHISLMQHIKEVESEAELEARFRWMCARNGLNRQCYIPIIASGPRAAVLHYTDNDKLIPKTQHSLVLVDAGGEGRCYGSDITRTFPATGKFSKEATTIYNIVLKAQKAVIKKLRPGIYWRDMHNLVVRTLTEELVRIGILIGDVDTLIELEIYRTFYFHGTGHSVGLDCHDVGGQDIGILMQRKGRALTLLNRPLEKDMVITVEPGLYFNDVSLNDKPKHPSYSPYYNMEKINRYKGIGGVRIEDTLLITENGSENFTIVPKEVDDIEHLIMLSI